MSSTRTEETVVHGGDAHAALRPHTDTDSASWTPGSSGSSDVSDAVLSMNSAPFIALRNNIDVPVGTALRSKLAPVC